MFFQKKSTTIVLQGEFAIEKGASTAIITSKATTCHIVVIYNRKYQIYGMAHIDCFTDASIVTQLIDAIKTQLPKNEPNEFEGYFGKGVDYVPGIPFDMNELKITTKQILDIIQRLESFCKKIEFLPLGLRKEERTQLKIILDKPDDGLKFVKIQQDDQRLERLQETEYSEFHRFLDRCYGRCEDAFLIPFFEGKQALRTLEQLPELCNEERIVVSIERVVVVPIDKLEALSRLLSRFSEPRFQEAFRVKNFNLLLRLSAVEAEHLELLKFLLANIKSFNIDTNARGATSGTALDIAKKYNNTEAEILLSPMVDKARLSPFKL